MAKILSEVFEDVDTLWFRLGIVSSSSTDTSNRKKKLYPYGPLWNKVNNEKNLWRKGNPELYVEVQQAAARRSEAQKKRKADRPKRARKAAKEDVAPEAPTVKTFKGEETCIQQHYAF